MIMSLSSLLRNYNDTTTKLQCCCTFGDYADTFVACFQTVWTHYNTSYDTCDRYLGQQLIKLSTCTKRKTKRRSIRKLIWGPEVRLPRGEQGRFCNESIRRTFTRKKLNHCCSRWLSGSSSKLIMKRQKHV